MPCRKRDDACDSADSFTGSIPKAAPAGCLGCSEGPWSEEADVCGRL